MSRRQSKYVRVNPQDPIAAAECDRCGRWFSRTDLVWQNVWAGTHLYATGALVCTTGNCYDTPNEQLRTIILPPDPPPVLNARVPNFAYEEQTVRIIQFANPLMTPPKQPWAQGPQTLRATQFAGDLDSGVARVLQYTTSS